MSERDEMIRELRAKKAELEAQFGEVLTRMKVPEERHGKVLALLLESGGLAGKTRTELGPILEDLTRAMWGGPAPWEPTTEQRMLMAVVLDEFATDGEREAFVPYQNRLDAVGEVVALAGYPDVAAMLKPEPDFQLTMISLVSDPEPGCEIQKPKLDSQGSVAKAFWERQRKMREQLDALKASLPPVPAEEPEATEAPAEGEAGPEPDWSKYQPRENLVLVEEMGQPDRTPGGLWMPDPYKATEWRFGRVIAVGPGKLVKHGHRTPMDFEPGQIVMHSRRHGTQLRKNKAGNVLRLLDTQQILCRVHDFRPWWDTKTAQASLGSSNSG
jgi:co-chaperonin GroES (HSP10)